MTVTPEPPEPTDRPLDLEGVPDEEDVSTADAAERVGLDPEEQRNRTDPDRTDPVRTDPEGDRR